MLVTGHCNLYKKIWHETVKLFAWHLKVLEAMPIDWTSSPKCNLPFDFATRYPTGSKERLACSATLEHHIKIGSVQELPLETFNGLRSTFFPIPKKGTGKMRGCVDLRKRTSCIRHKHFKIGAAYYSAAHLPQQLDHQGGSELLLQALPHQPCRPRFMWFIWEGNKYQCISMPFGLALASRLATKMMALVICYL